MGLPRRLIEPEPAITSVLLQYACKHSLADSTTASPYFDSVISISEYEQRHFDAFELYFIQAMCSLFISQRIVYTESRCTQRRLQYDKS